MHSVCSHVQKMNLAYMMMNEEEEEDEEEDDDDDDDHDDDIADHVVVDRVIDNPLPWLISIVLLMTVITIIIQHYRNKL